MAGYLSRERRLKKSLSVKVWPDLRLLNLIQSIVDFKEPFQHIMLGDHEPVIQYTGDWEGEAAHLGS